MLRKIPPFAAPLAAPPAALLAALLALCTAGCEVDTPPAPASITGAEFIAFRCVPRTEAELADIRSRLPADRRAEFQPVGAAGAPLDGCGCTTIAADGTINFLPGDLCAAGNAEIRAYVGGNDRGEVSVLRVSRDATFPARRILDVDNTIPGVTGIFVDDIITDVESDPDGRFVISVNSSTGSIALLQNDRSVLPALTIEFGIGPLLTATVWPSPERPIGRTAPATGDAPRRAWITAPQARRILEIDLDVLADLIAGGASATEDIVTAVLDLPDAVPAEIAVHPDGDRLYVGHATQPRISVFDLATGERTAIIDLTRRPICGDGYLTRIIAFADDRSCQDGLDNDGDGRVDADDPDCGGTHGIEAIDPTCPQRSQCADGIDNDGDDLIDRDDPDCDAIGRFEGPVPQCANGIDDDADGLIDRADPGCANEEDNAEDTGDTFEGPGPGGRCYEIADESADATEDEDGDGLIFVGGPGCETCADAIDNDADGLIDSDDPGCVDPDYASVRYTEERLARCADGIDQDRDGLIDFAGGDPDCHSAADDTEGGSTIELGPTELLTARVPLNGALVDHLYAIEPGGYLVVIDLDDPALRVRYTGLRDAVQAMAHRAYGLAHSILTVLADTSLRSVEITAPTILRTADGRDVFARRPDAWTGTNASRLEASVGVLVRDFYVVVDGVARRVDALNGMCATDPIDGTACLDPGTERIADICAPRACNADEACDGRRCIEGYCLPTCESDADCPANRRCDLTVNACRTHCTIDERNTLVIDPPAECTGETCDAACDADTPCAPGLSCQDGACTAPCTDALCRLTVDLATAPPVQPQSRGQADPLVHLDHQRLVHDQANVFLSAAARTTRVPEVPRLRIRGTPVGLDAERFPVFCQLPQPYFIDADAPIDADEECVAESGTEAATADLQDLEGTACTADVECADARLRCVSSRCTACADAACRLRFRTDAYGGIQIVTLDPAEIPDQEFAIAYEGALPGTESFTGRHGGPVEVTVDDPVSASTPVVAGWELIDYDRDFCRVGVEAGDLVVIDRVAPLASASNDPACDPFVATNDNVAPDQRREPLRYRVAEVTPFRLVLRPDGTSRADRTAYDDMLPRDDRLPQPRLAPPLPSPPAQCAAQLTAYRVRVADEWIIVGGETGYRHPWVRDGGTCAIDPQRAARHSRVKLGLPFQNEWFRFRLGDTRQSDGVDPYMIDAEYRFRVDNGHATSGLTGAIVVPQGMKWLPNNDRLYIVDGGQRTVIEIGGLDVYRQIMSVEIPPSPYR